VLESLRRALGRAAGGPLSRQSALAPVPRVSAVFAALAVATSEGFAREEACLAAANAVLEQTVGPFHRMSSGDAERAHAAARFIEAHAAEPLTLDTVAAHLALSTFHFVRVFRDAIGVTPHQYLMRVRLLRAIALLRDTRLPVTEVAYESGWSDLSTFNRTFRRRRRMRSASVPQWKLRAGATWPALPRRDVFVADPEGTAAASP
jgi:transcriptional regulator GlxA family with amidase domain